MVDRSFDIVCDTGIVAKEVPEDKLLYMINAILDNEKLSCVTLIDHVYNQNN